MLVNDERSSWYARVGKFLKYQFDIGEKKPYTAMDQHALPNKTTSLQSAWSMALSGVTVVWAIYLFVYLIIY